MDPVLIPEDARSLTRVRSAFLRFRSAPPLIEYPSLDSQVWQAENEMGVAAVCLHGSDEGEDARAVELAILQSIDGRRVNMLLARFEKTISSGAHGILRRFIHRAVEPCTVGELAADLGLTEWTLQRRCRHLGIPPPKKLFCLARVFAVMRLLQWSHQSLSSVATALGFSDRANCRRLVCRTLRRAPSHYMALVEADPVDEAIVRNLGVCAIEAQGVTGRREGRCGP